MNIFLFVSSLKNKQCKFSSWVCQCLWGIAKLVLLCPCKFCKENFNCFVPFKHKMFKLIAWNDCNFSMVIKIVLRCNMKQLCDTWNGLGGGDYIVFFNVSIKFLSFKQQKVHFVGSSRFLLEIFFV